MENCLKVVVLGGDTAGKTSLILVKTKHKFPYRRVHRLADPTIVRTRIDGKTYTFSVWDTKKVQEREKDAFFYFTDRANSHNVFYVIDHYVFYVTDRAMWTASLPRPRTHHRRVHAVFRGGRSVGIPSSHPQMAAAAQNQVPVCSRGFSCL